MPSPTPTEDLLDLRMLPAWASEPARPHAYSDFEGEDAEAGSRRPDRRQNRDRDQRSPRPRDRSERRPQRDNRSRGPRPDGNRRDMERSSEPRRDEPREIAPPLAVTVRFLPHQRAFENVIAQIKSGSVAYSVFALARLFLEKPERYDVRVTMPEGVQVFQLGENGPVATDRRILEGSAFASSHDDYYAVEVTQSEPLKGNFTNVARCRLSGTLLGPTNHHAYQSQLRGLYESRFSRRMSFPDYQRQIEIVSDPAVVEEWKEQARSVTTYRTKNEEPSVTFSSAAEAERHFRQTYLPQLIRESNELTIGGVASRRLPDRRLGRAIEDAWAQETRSPAKMMQELSAGLRGAGLNIFRHRRGMLFVSPIRSRVFGHERAGVSASINAILEKVAATPGINRKTLAEQLAVAEADAAVADRAKMTLANDLHWLIREGYVIEFNDGSLDLPRAKAPQPEKPGPVADKAPETVHAAAPEEAPVPEPDAMPVAKVEETPVPVEPAAVAGNADPGPESAVDSSAEAVGRPENG
ncbi:MAG TPA: hypothetical protein VM940_01740 [Chthoniobacterales bacterium]|nr:hypothetical protein [Chthoniobacterales bacterium]